MGALPGWNALGGIVWTCLYGFGAYMLGNQVHKFVGPFGITCGVVVGAVLAWGILFLRKHEHRLMAEAEVAMARTRPRWRPGDEVDTVPKQPARSRAPSHLPLRGAQPRGNPATRRARQPPLGCRAAPVFAPERAAPGLMP